VACNHHRKEKSDLGLPRDGGPVGGDETDYADSDEKGADDVDGHQECAGGFCGEVVEAVLLRDIAGLVGGYQAVGLEEGQVLFQMPSESGGSFGRFHVSLTKSILLALIW